MLNTMGIVVIEGPRRSGSLTNGNWNPKSGIGTGEFSVGALLNNGHVSAGELLWTLTDLTQTLVRGGWH